MKRLWAISDLHLGHRVNAEALDALPDHGDDWLIVAGDVGESLDHLQRGLERLKRSFSRLIWVPGNHELWSVRGDGGLRGEDKYGALVDRCRRLDVLTPEDDWPVWDGAGGRHVLVPMFLLYDYTFGPDDVTPDRAVDWSRQTGVVCADESYLHSDPHASRSAWCHARCDRTEERLEALDPSLPTVLINHWPLRRELAVLPRIPRFRIWCGTRRTEDWHRRFRASTVVYGHLHIRRSRRIDGVRFEEVSLGYPAQWKPRRGVAAYLRPLLTG